MRIAPGRLGSVRGTPRTLRRVLTDDRYEHLLVERRDHGIAVVTLNRPDRLNAVNKVLHNELATFSRDAQQDASVRAVVLTGSGRAFCAGGDFAGDEWAGADPNALDEGRQIVDNLLDLQKPIVSAVHGYAMGLGATIALLCDVVVAGRSAVFADTHVKMGIGAGDGGAVIWPLLMGVNRAKWHLMTGERVTGDDLHQLGLVTHLVDDDQVQDTAMACATTLARGSASAIAASKVPINTYIKMVSNLVLPLSMRMEALTMQSKDAAEAQAAFREKREPNFSDD
jgi:enoyl-CoA hydratase